MRIILAILSLALLGSLLLNFSNHLHSQSRDQQLADFRNQSEHLLAEIESNARQRLSGEREIEQLRQELNQLRERNRTLTRTLADTRELLDPDIGQLQQEMETRTRERLENEYRQCLATQSRNLDDPQLTAASVMSQLSKLSAEERIALISVQGQYGQFIDSLNGVPERIQRVAQALVDINLSQTQARRDLMSLGLDPQETRERIMEIMSPDTVRESLAYDLTDEELAAFDRFQQQPYSAFVTGPAGDTGVFMIRGEGTARAQQLLQQGADFISNGAPPPEPRQQIIFMQEGDSVGNQ